MLTTKFNQTVQHEEENDFTEDEEIKQNVFARAEGFHASDLDDSESEEESSEEEDEEQEGVLRFVRNLVSERPVAHPKAINVNYSDEASSLDEDEEEADDSGVRGVPFSIGTPPEGQSVDDTSSVSDSDEDDEDEDHLLESDEEIDESEDEEASHPFIGEDVVRHFEDSSELIDNEISRILRESSGASSPYESEDEESVESRVEREEHLDLPKSKRVLSLSHLADLDDDEPETPKTPKKRRMSLDEDEPPMMPDLDLGPSMLAGIHRSLSKIRLESPTLNSTDDEEYDNELRSELERRESETDESSPVPLLTPPGSPLTLEVDGATLLEWPSNLAVDSAQLASYQLRPMSPDSLQIFEEQEEERVKAAGDTAKDSETTTLTPMLRGIYVD